MGTISNSNIHILKDERLQILKLINDTVLKLYTDDTIRTNIIEKLKVIVNKCCEFVRLESILSNYEFNSKEYCNDLSFNCTNMALKHFIKNGDALADNISIYDWFILKSEVYYFLNQLKNPNITVEKLDEVVKAFNRSTIKDYTLNDGLSIDTINRAYNKLVYSFNSMRYDSYNNYLETEHWKRFSSTARKHFGERCSCCGTKVNLEVHHNNYNCIGEETFSDVCLLCNNCHKKMHHKP